MRTATLFTLCAIISVGLALGYGSYGSSYGFIPTFQQAPSTGFGDGTFLILIGALFLFLILLSGNGLNFTSSSSAPVVTLQSG